MQQQNNYHYTFEELQTYLYSYADLFQQDRVQDGIHLYSKNAKNIFKKNKNGRSNTSICTKT